MRSARIPTLMLAALLLLASPAAAAGPECPECDEDVPANDDCSYSSIDGGVIGEDEGYLYDTDLCVSKPDDPRGFWAVFSFCLVSWFGGIVEFIGFDLWIDSYVSEDGVDLDGGVVTPLGDVELEGTPASGVDDMTWQTLDEAPDTDLTAPEFPTIDEDNCIFVEDLALDACGE